MEEQINSSEQEMNETDNALYGMVDPELYQDLYYLRLSRSPANGTSVQIKIESEHVATDYSSLFTPSYRDISKRPQVYINGSETTSLTFTSANWSEEVLLRITAIDDEVEEGVNLLNFATQPSSLVRFLLCCSLFLT